MGKFDYDPSNLHLTVLDKFVLSNKNVFDFTKTCSQIVRWFSPLELEPLSHEYFGRRKDIPVLKVGNNGLKEVHCSFVDAVSKYAGKFYYPEFAREGFNPHVSYADPEDMWTMKTLSFVHHRGGFGVDVVNYCNWEFSG